MAFWRSTAVRISKRSSRFVRNAVETSAPFSYVIVAVVTMWVSRCDPLKFVRYGAKRKNLIPALM